MNDEVQTDSDIETESRFLRLDSPEQVYEIDADTYLVSIHADLLYPHLTHFLRALKARILDLVDSGFGINLTVIELTGDGSLQPDLMKSDDWKALADVVNICATTEVDLELNFYHGLCTSSAVPASFLLSLRQHACDLQINFDGDRDPEELHAILLDQNQQIHTPPISPFSIKAISLDSFHPSHVVRFLRLSRCGPEIMILKDDDVFTRDDWGKSVDEVMNLLEGNFWMQWSTPILEKGRASWAIRHGAPLPRDLGATAFDEIEFSNDLLVRLRALNERNESLRNTTRAAATILLRAARPLIFSVPIQKLPQLEPCPSTATTSSQLPDPTSPSATLPSDSSTSNPASSLAPVFPILSLPGELLDLILTLLSPGCLSTSQHRVVMNWAGDRSTLGATNRAAPRTDFLRETNCWRWESEDQDVNQGLLYVDESGSEDGSEAE